MGVALAHSTSWGSSFFLTRIQQLFKKSNEHMHRHKVLLSYNFSVAYCSWKIPMEIAVGKAGKPIFEKHSSFHKYCNLSQYMCSPKPNRNSGSTICLQHFFWTGTRDTSTKRNSQQRRAVKEYCKRAATTAHMSFSLRKHRVTIHEAHHHCITLQLFWLILPCALWIRYVPAEV